MENYHKTRTVEQPCPSPFPGLPPDTPEVCVKDGSKIRNLMRFALSRMETKSKPAEGEEGHKTDEGFVAMEIQEATDHPPAPEKPLIGQIVFRASGKGVSKAITCTELVKRRVKGLHQHTKLLYSTAVDVWDPLEPTAGLDSLTVSRNIPSIWILLSKDPLDSSLPGYQAPGNFDTLWAQSLRDDGGAFGGQRRGQRRKRGGGGGAGALAGGGASSSRGKARPARQMGRPR
ncbi:ribonuclease P protein subunit p25-like protein [Lampris incognitus]|uniref:ribonuclease P protein subunit p25-like protein n=1 Tax=Lampris incognitus TaxID=2546036 RepID=UPI0024B53847|nr:ribonuclease P protein subunit p25-like protein [Lampris incognitus]XP_056142767.1 ribonuclease P protein subunit p25-like protein [Lampris incognitus]